jgi:hypothetical protein
MWPARNWSESYKEVSRNSIGITYISTTVALECAVINLVVPIIDANSSALKVVHVARRELERKLEKHFAEIVTVAVALFISKMVSWISKLAYLA